MRRGAEPKFSTIRIRRDRAARIQYSTTDETQRAARRFGDFQRVLLSGPVLSPVAEVVARLVAFELIFDRGELSDIVSALPGGVYRTSDNKLLLEWSWGAGWVDRRVLHPLSGLALERLGEAPAAGDMRPELARLIRTVVPAWDDANDEVVLASLLHAGHAWAALNLPGFLVAHVCRDAPLCALPRSALARGETGRGLVDAQGERLRRTDPRQIGSLLDAVLSKAPPASDLRPLIVALKSAIRTPIKQGGTHQRMRQAMLDAIAPLTDAAARAGWQVALIYAWTVDFIESGTQRVAALSVNTILGYVPPVLEPLLNELVLLSEVPCDAGTWSGLYQRVLASRGQGARKNAVSALASFHRHLVAWHEVEPMAVALHGELDELPPAANTIWPHELARIQDWLDKATFDPRLVATLRVVFQLAWSCRLRTSELLTLRLNNVGETVIEVAPMIRDRAPKSDSGLRTMGLDAPAQALLAQWVRRRRSEGAQDDAFLFGDPHAPERVYRRALLQQLLIELPRAATGDLDVVFHTLSHAWCNRQLSDRQRPVGDVDWLTGVTAGMGHFSAASLRPYANQYESWLAEEIQRGLSLQGKLQSAQAARLLGEPEVRVRKRLERARRRNPDANAWHLLDAWRPGPRWPGVAEGIELAEPQCPHWLVGETPIMAERVAKILDDLTHDPDKIDLKDLMARVCSRNGCTVEQVRVIAQITMQLLRMLGAWAPQQRVWTHGRQTGIYLIGLLGRRWHQSDIDWRRRHAEKLRPILSGLPTSVLDPVWLAWAEAYRRRGYMALAPASAGTLFEWLKGCGVSGLCLAISRCKKEKPQRIAAIQGAFRMVFGVSCHSFEHCEGQGTPGIYLLWSSTPITEGVRPGPASISLAGFHAWMLAAGVAAVLREGRTELSGLVLQTCTDHPEELEHD
jgi:integrase